MPASDTINYEDVFLQAPIGMCISQQRVILACNHRLAQMFKLPRESLIGQSFLLMYPTLDEFERTGTRIAPIMNAKGLYSDERIMKRADHELFWCHVSGRALMSHEADNTAIWSFEDLSEKRSVSAELTPREREIAALLVVGKTSKMIAREIDLSPRTVEMHRARLMRKFSAATSSELVHRLLRA